MYDIDDIITNIIFVKRRLFTFYETLQIIAFGSEDYQLRFAIIF